MQNIAEPQAGEWSVLRALLPDDPVSYVDIGAGEYAHCNNTWPFYALGGSGLLIEPVPELCEDLLRYRPRDTVCQRACWNDVRDLELRLAYGATTARADWNIEHIQQGTLIVQAATIAHILNEYPQFKACDLCSIDVEGCERQVLEGFDWQSFMPRVIIIEYIRYEPETTGEDISSEWVDLLTTNGMYRECCRSWLNIIYIRGDSWHRWLDVKDHVQLPHQSVEESRAYYKERYGIE